MTCHAFVVGLSSERSVLLLHFSRSLRLPRRFEIVRHLGPTGMSLELEHVFFVSYA